jgi:hypothetical protein
MNDIEKIESLLRHIRNVQDNCELLGKKLIENYLKLDKRAQKKSNDLHIGKQLIANSREHDKSKFYGIEWEHLGKGDPFLGKAVIQHNRSNPHHPEYWGDIHQMPDVYIAEMVCDWKARSSEFGTDLKEFIEEKAQKRWGFKLTGVPVDSVGLKIKKYLSLLLDESFN